MRETTAQGGVVYQDNHMAYDALGRMRWVADGYSTITIDYDLVGNRTHVQTHLPDHLANDRHQYFLYDEMNRQVVVDARGAIPSTSNPIFDAAIRGAVGNALTQGIAVATGLQSSFSWKSVAASAVGAGVGQAVGGVANKVFGGSNMGQFATRAVSGFAAGMTTAAMRGGRISATQVATDAFGNALGDSIAAANGQRADPLGDFIGEQLAAQDRRDTYGLLGGIAPTTQGFRPGGGYGLQPSASAVDIWNTEVEWRTSVAAARLNAAEGAASADRATAIPTVRDDGGSPSFLDSVRAATGRDDFEYDDGSDWSTLQTGGARSGGARYKQGSIVQLARNEGRDGAMNGIDDITGFLGMMGDYRAIGNTLQLQAQAKQNMAELADIRKDLIELGKKPPLEGPELIAEGDGPRVLAEKLTEHRNYVRLVLLERAGQLTLNDDLSIRDIGKDRLSPEEFAIQLRKAYEGGVVKGASIADQRAANGQLSVSPFLALKVGDAAAEQIAKGNIVDGFAKDSAKLFLERQGLFEGSFGLVSINRRFYSDTGLMDQYRVPDVLVNYGPRSILALDATLGMKTADTPQVRDAFRYGVTDWGSVTRRGTQWINNPAGVTPRIQWRGK